MLFVTDAAVRSRGAGLRSFGEPIPA